MRSEGQSGARPPHSKLGFAPAALWPTSRKEPCWMRLGPGLSFIGEIPHAQRRPKRRQAAALQIGIRPCSALAHLTKRALLDAPRSGVIVHMRDTPCAAKAKAAPGRRTPN